MLESIFKQGFARARHRVAPFWDEREQYLVHLHQQGTSLHSIRETAAMLLNVVEHLEIESFSGIDRLAIQNANKRWLRKTRRHQQAGAKGTSIKFMTAAVGWLRFHNALVADPGTPLSIWRRASGLPAIHLRPEVHDTGNSDRLPVESFEVPELGIGRHSSFDAIMVGDIADYFKALHDGGMKPRSIVSVCQTLRSLFKFTESRGWTPSLISAGIVAPSTPRYDPDPKGPRWSEVRRMLSAKTQSDPITLRANAVLFLFAIYGLRSIEVSSLQLDDLDWEEETLTIRRAKGGRIQRFPITSEVGNALVLYLTKARPKCTSRSFFVTRAPPFRATVHGSLRNIVASRMKQLKIKSVLYSTHALRHSCATQLLHEGVSMDEIARFLGHTNNKSVGIYAKCSKVSVRKVADFSLDGLK